MMEAGMVSNISIYDSYIYKDIVQYTKNDDWYKQWNKLYILKQ